MNENAGIGILLILGIACGLGRLLLSAVDWHLGARAWRELVHHQLAAGDRVGWLVRCDDQPAHTRLRTLRKDAFNIFDTDWQIQAQVIGALKSRVEQAGWTGIDLCDTALDVDRLAGLVTLEGDKWVVWDDSSLHRLRDELGLTALVVVRPGKVAVREIGDEHGSRIQYAQRTGLATDSALLTTDCLAVLACEWQVFWLDPAVALTQGRSVDTLLRMPSVAIRGYHKTHNIDRLTAADLEPVRMQVMTLIDRTAEAVAGILALGTQRKPHTQAPSQPRAVATVAER